MQLLPVDHAYGISVCCYLLVLVLGAENCVFFLKLRDTKRGGDSRWWSLCVGDNIPLKKGRDRSSGRERRVLMLARVRTHSYVSYGNVIFIALFCIPSSRSGSDTVRPVCHTRPAYSNSKRTSETFILTIWMLATPARCKRCKKSLWCLAMYHRYVWTPPQVIGYNHTQ